VRSVVLRNALRLDGEGLWRGPAQLLCVLLALALGLGFVSSASAAGTGSIAGVVTELSAPHAAIEGIEVCAFPTSLEEEAEGSFAELIGCAKTQEGGKYTIAGLASGEYDVEFFSPANSKLNFAFQYYDAKTSFEDATPVSVSSGATTSGIDAELEAGGSISGTVRRAVNGEPIAGIEVCAFSIAVESFGCATSEANGEYTVVGLRGGAKYFVEFSSPAQSGLDYLTQHYRDRPTPEGAETVSVFTGQTTPGVDARLEEGGFISGRVTDASTGAPLDLVLVCAIAVSGPQERCTGTNANGEYKSPVLASGSYKLMFVAPRYLAQYYNDSASLTGAAAISVSVGETTSGIDAALQRTAAKTKVAPTGPPPPVRLPIAPVLVTPSPTPLIEIAAAKILVAGGSARGLQLACAGARCQGSIELTMQVAFKRRKGGRTVSRKQTIVLAKGAFSIAAGAGSAIVLHLTAAGHKQLAHVKRHPLRVKLVLSLTGGAAQGQSVLVR
jgi:hypothetical protein